MTNNLLKNINNAEDNEETQWITLSDLMTGLMMIFLLIAITFMLKLESENSEVKQIIVVYDKVKQDLAKATQIAVVYDKVKQDLHNQLLTEFKNDLPKWQAEITNDLTIRFKEPSVLFNTGEYEIKPAFKNILSDFFPRYVLIITKQDYKDSIQEIRIEGHTSSAWQGSTDADDAYYKNMALSQSRTRSTLSFCMSLMTKDRDWLKSHITANGLSSSHLINNSDGSENPALSQRVEFRILTNAEAKIANILENIR